VVHFLVDLADNIRGNLGSGCFEADVAKHTGLPNEHKKSCPQMNAELLLLS
jgi:hypothetical protein